MDNLSIDELLAAATVKSPLVKTETRIDILWIHSPSTVTCTQCGRIYHGKKFHPSISPPEPSKVGWCPLCIKPEIFWLHQYFDVGSIDESKLIEMRMD